MFLSLSIVNTDEDSFRLFISKLAAKLNSERPGWKKDTIVLMDNASYHTSDLTREYFAHLGIRTMYTAPYSYQAAPVEMFFAAFKSKNINTRMESTGKR